MSGYSEEDIETQIADLRKELKTISKMYDDIDNAFEVYRVEYFKKHIEIRLREDELIKKLRILGVDA